MGAASVQHVAGGYLLDLRQCDDLADDRLLDLLSVLAHDLEQMADLDGLLLVAQDVGGVGRGRALKHANPRQFADERVRGNLEGLGDEGSTRVGLECDLLALAVGGGIDRPMLDDIRRGEVVGHRVHQFGDADFRLGGREEYRNERALDHGPPDRSPELVCGNLLAAEIGLHHLLVGFDDVLDQLRVGIGDIADVG